jgi:hypothetical protein
MVDKIKSTKVARFNLVAKFREKTVMKLLIFFTLLKNDEKKVKNSDEIIYFLHCFLFSSSFLTFYNLYLHICSSPEEASMLANI